VTPLITISETVTIDTSGSIIKPKVEPTPITTQKTKNSRKTIPIPSTTDDKKMKMKPEDVIRYGSIFSHLFLIFYFSLEQEFAKLFLIQ
jgi:hypothetical protein